MKTNMKTNMKINMKININNQEKIQNILYEVQKNSKKRCIEYIDILDMAKRGEEFLHQCPNKIKKGNIISNETLLPVSYKYSGEFTQVGLYRGGKGWFLVNCRRVVCNKIQYGKEKITLYKTSDLYEWETNQIKMNIDI